MSAEQDQRIEAHIAFHYRRDLGSVLCPGHGIEPTPEAVRDAFFAGHRAGWIAAEDWASGAIGRLRTIYEECEQAARQMSRSIEETGERAERIEAALAAVTKVVTVRNGEHEHVTLWVNHAKVGTLVLRAEEFEVFRSALESAG